MIFELDQTTSGEWDRFQLRNIGLAVQRRMAANYQGDAKKFRSATVKELERILGLSASNWRIKQGPALSDFAAALSLVPDLDEWSDGEKLALIIIIRAKSAPDESSYLSLSQRHRRLRAAMIKLGSV